MKTKLKVHHRNGNVGTISYEPYSIGRISGYFSKILELPLIIIIVNFIAKITIKTENQFFEIHPMEFILWNSSSEFILRKNYSL